HAARPGLARVSDSDSDSDPNVQRHTRASGAQAVPSHPRGSGFVVGARVARVSEAHPGPRTKRASSRNQAATPSPDAAFGLIRATKARRPRALTGQGFEVRDGMRPAYESNRRSACSLTAGSGARQREQIGYTVVRTRPRRLSRMGRQVRPRPVARVSEAHPGLRTELVAAEPSLTVSPGCGLWPYPGYKTRRPPLSQRERVWR